MDTGYMSEPSRSTLVRGAAGTSSFHFPAAVNSQQATTSKGWVENCTSQPPRSGSRGPLLPNSPRHNATSSDTNDDVGTQRRRIGIAGDADTDDLTEILLAVVWYGGNLGAAYYDTDSAIVHVFLDIIESDSFTVLKKLLHEVRPSAIITSAKQDERMMQVLRTFEGDGDDDAATTFNSSRESIERERMRRAAENSDHRESSEFKATLEILPGLAFSYEASKRRICSMELPAIPDHYTELEKTLYFSSRLPFGCTSAVRATGGLIRYLAKHRIGVGLEDEDVQTPILDLKIFSLADVMFIERSTYRALQIFKKIDHPAVFKMGSGAREGLSLFGIMNRTRSHPGRKLLRLWFNRPLTNKDIIDQRLDAVEYLADPKHLETSESLQDAIKHTRNLTRILKVMKTATASANDWMGLYKTVVSVLSIANICRSAPRTQSGHLPKIFYDITNCSTQDLVTVVKLIFGIMDEEQSIAENRFVVLPGVDSDLDKKKDQYNGLPCYLYHVARSELQTFQPHISTCHVMYMRRIGYMLALAQSEDINESRCAIPGLDFMLTSDGTCYYKTERMRELDTELGDILEEIGDMETRIMHQLQNTILEYAPTLVEMCQYVAQLDCLISFAIVATEQGYVRPTLSDENIVDVKKGRHPLQECIVPLFVPNDVVLGGDGGRIKLITGPNACGKSIFLKQAGLIVYMAHIGSFVPAERATIGIVSKMYTRIRSMESVSNELSTFAVDLNQMRAAVSGSNKNTLVLVDEFGKGTASVDGTSFLASCLIHWTELNDDCPFVICSTHFHSLVKQKLLPPTPLLRFYTLEVLRDKAKDDLVFLYQLVEGVAGCSYAAHVALLAGLPREIVARGKEVTSLLRDNAPVRRYDSSSTKSYMKRCAEVAEKLRTLQTGDDSSAAEFLKSVKEHLETPAAKQRTGSFFNDTSGREVTSSSVTSPSPDVSKRHANDLHPDDEDVIAVPSSEMTSSSVTSPSPDVIKRHANDERPDDEDVIAVPSSEMASSPVTSPSPDVIMRHANDERPDDEDVIAVPSSEMTSSSVTSPSPDVIMRHANDERPDDEDVIAVPSSEMASSSFKSPSDVIMRHANDKRPDDEDVIAVPSAEMASQEKEQEEG